MVSMQADSEPVERMLLAFLTPPPQEGTKLVHTKCRPVSTQFDMGHCSASTHVEVGMPGDSHTAIVTPHLSRMRQAVAWHLAAQSPPCSVALQVAFNAKSVIPAMLQVQDFMLSNQVGRLTVQYCWQ